VFYLLVAGTLLFRPGSSTPQPREPRVPAHAAR
jgi:hypothetical protein